MKLWSTRRLWLRTLWHQEDMSSNLFVKKPNLAMRPLRSEIIRIAYNRLSLCTRTLAAHKSWAQRTPPLRLSNRYRVNSNGRRRLPTSGRTYQTSSSSRLKLGQRRNRKALSKGQCGDDKVVGPHHW